VALTNEDRRSADAINRDLAEAIACYCVFLPTGRDRDLIGRINAGGINPGYNVISESLHRSVILALCRIWDKSGDSVHIPSFVRALSKSSISAAAKGEIAKLKPAIDGVVDSDELEALKRLRHLYLAHTADPNKAYRGKARTAVYGDERKVIESSIPIVESINEATGYRPIDYAGLRRLWDEQSKNFWNNVLQVDEQ
jgi:hypothetical protein